MRLAMMVLCCVLAMTLGCATAPAPHTIKNAFHFTDGYDEVWAAVMESMAELSLPIQTLEKESGLIATDWISFEGLDACDCGSAGIMTDSDRQGKFNIFAKRNAAGGVDVKINTVFQVRRSFDTTSRVITCYSTGLLESKLNGWINDKLKTTKA